MRLSLSRYVSWHSYTSGVVAPVESKVGASVDTVGAELGAEVGAEVGDSVGGRKFQNDPSSLRCGVTVSRDQSFNNNKRLMKDHNKRTNSVVAADTFS